MRIPLTVCGFHLQFADSAYNYGFRNSSIQLYTCLIICGFHELFWIPQIRLRIPQICLFWSNFERYSVLGICLWNSKQQRRSNKCSNVADSTTNLIWACCGIRLRCTECTVWPRNVKFSILFKIFTHVLFHGLRVFGLNWLVFCINL